MPFICSTTQKDEQIIMQQTAVIKVLCRVENLDNTAHLIQWAVGHRVEIDTTQADDHIRCLFVFTNIEYYENDDTILDRLGLNIIGKIKGVVSWEVIPRHQDVPSQREDIAPDDGLEDEIAKRLRQLPIAISIMRRLTGKYAWKCLEAEGHADTFPVALEAALLHFTRSYKMIKEELLG